MKNRTRGLAIASALTLTSLVLAGCSASGGTGDASASSTPVDGGTINWAYTSAPANWDPLVIGGTSGTYLTTPIYASLFTLDTDHNIVPDLATGFDYNTAGDQITIHLKTGLTFQDGTPVNAAAVKFNIDRIFSQTNSALKAVYADVKDAVVIDDATVQLDLKQTDYQIPYILAEKTGQLESPTAVQKDPVAFNASGPVGAGPFIVEELVPGDHVTLKKWDGYWNAANIHLDTIRINFGVSPTTLVSALQSGVDNFATLTPDLVDQATQAGLTVQDTKSWGSSFLSVNTNQAPFNNPAVVKAIRLATNPDQYVQQLALGKGQSNYQPFPQGHVDFVQSLTTENTYNVDAAKKALSDAGVDPSSISFDVNYLTGQFDKVGEVLKSQLAAIGITVNLKALDTATWAKGYYGKTFGASLFGWVGRDSPVSAISDQYDSLGVLNLSSPTVSPDLTAALSKARSTPLDSPDYDANLQAAAKVGYETASNISLYTYSTPVARGAGVSELPAVDGFIDWTGVYVSDN
ncbi:ABC transporter substrate-binding protein [Subtercola sp. YIM 133946]|uniref:ABC transporter substrate-binding protein n=1 Tax=Subtercola sp. YIM 133946 TaxID=3118909 RepID=UPI002F951F6E